MGPNYSLAPQTLMTGVTAAIADAVWHATGRRIRDLPITIEKLM